MRAPFRLPDGAPGRLGLLLAQLEEGRARTLRHVAKVPPERLHWSSAEFPNSLAAHLAVIELDWLYCDLLGVDIPADVVAWFPIADVRQADGRLCQAEDVGLPRLLDFLARARARLLEVVSRLEEAGLSELVEGQEGAATPEWILTHLAQHEAEHRGVLRRMVASWSAGT
jgi:uncharacterized damage-inducible protein DinB